MPNFHQDDFAIAANKEGMLAVLQKMASNYAAGSLYTGYDESIEGLDVEETFKVLQPYLNSYYMFVFRSKPLGIGDDVQGEKIDLGNGATIQTTTAARGRAASETADSVGLLKVKDVYILSLYYETAWEPNTRDVVEFLKSLPKGDFGFSMLDADEYDDYETISAFAQGLSSDGKVSTPTDTFVEGDKNRAELKSEFEKYRSASSAGSSLPEIAYAATLRAWEKWGWDEDEDEDDETDHDSDFKEDGGFSYFEEVEAGNGLPLAVALSDTVEYGLNRTWSIEGTDHLNRNDHIESVKAKPAPVNHSLNYLEEFNAPWSMKEGKRAKAAKAEFSIDIPDKFEIIEGLNGRVFAAPFASECFTNDEGKRDADISESDAFEYVTMPIPRDQNTIDAIQEKVIPEYMIEFSRSAHYGEAARNPLIKNTDDWLVKGKNCDVLVYRAPHANLFGGIMSSLGLDDSAGEDLAICPVTNTGHDYLKVTVAWAHENDYTAADFLEQMKLMATTLEVKEPLHFKLLERLDSFAVKKTTADDFNEVVITLSNILNMTRNSKINNDLGREINRDEDAAQKKFHKTIAESFNEFSEVIACYYGQVVTALESQKNLGVSESELNKMAETVQTMRDEILVDVITMEEDRESERKVNRLKIIKIPAWVDEYDSHLHAISSKWLPKTPAADSAMAKEAERKRKEAEKAEAEAKRKEEEEKQAKVKELEAELTNLNKTLKGSGRETDEASAVRIAKEELEAFERIPKDIPAHTKDLLDAERAYKKLTDSVSAAETELAQMKKELAGLGIFAFGKKKELNAAIPAKESALLNLRKQVAESDEKKIFESLTSTCAKEQEIIDRDWDTRKKKLEIALDLSEKALKAAREKLNARKSEIQRELKKLDPAKYDKPAKSSTSTSSAGLDRYEKLAQQVLRIMPDDEPVLTSWIMSHVGEITTPQLCTKVMQVLVDQGFVRKVEKVEGRYTGYSVIRYGVVKHTSNNPVSSSSDYSSTSNSCSSSSHYSSSAYGSNRNSAASENEVLARQVAMVMPYDEPVLTSWIMAHVDGIMTPQKCTQVMQILIDKGRVVKVDKVNGRYTGYKLV